MKHQTKIKETLEHRDGVVVSLSAWKWEIIYRYYTYYTLAKEIMLRNGGLDGAKEELYTFCTEQRRLNSWLMMWCGMCGLVIYKLGERRTKSVHGREKVLV